MLRKDDTTKVVLIRDDDVKHPYDIDDFADKLNLTCDLMNYKLKTSPYTAFLNVYTSNPTAYNEFIEAGKTLVEQTKYLTGKLKLETLNVYLPDAKYFLTKYEEYQKLDDAVYKRKIIEDAKLCFEAVKFCVKENEKTARAHGIAIPYKDSKTTEKK